jgi:hypothetical protein
VDATGVAAFASGAGEMSWAGRAVRSIQVLSGWSFDGIDMADLGLTGAQLRAAARLAIVLGAIAALTFISLAVRVSCDRTTRSIRHYAAETERAASVHEQLQLDLAARRSAGSIEAAAAQLGLVPATRTEIVAAGAVAGVGQ